MKIFSFLIVAMAALVAVSCNSPPSVIQTDGLAVVPFIVERHDAYAVELAGEPDKTQFLSESAELMGLIQAAGETIPAGVIVQLGNRVANRHDNWITHDQTLNPFDATDFLRSSEIFRRVLVAASPLPDT